MRERVGVKARHAATSELVEHIALPRCDAAGQADFEHRASAAVTVFFSNIAIVSGPTPPGTGDNAPATSATSGCTSPTRIEPRLANVSRRFDPSGKSRSTVEASSI